MPDKGGIQLLPETRKKIEVRVPGENRMIWIGLTVAMLVGGLYYGVYTYVGSLEERIGEIGGQIRQLENERDKKSEEELKAYSLQSNIVGGILDNHIFTSQAIARLEAIVKPEIYLKNIEVDIAKKTLSFGIIANSYTMIARQIAVFQSDDAILDFEASKLTESEERKFESNITLKIDSGKYFTKP